MKKKLLLLAVIIFLVTGPVGAQANGFSDAFDDPALPGWERSPNATVANGWLRIEPGGFAFHSGTWNNSTLTATLRLTGNGAAVIKYQATDQSGYVLRFAVGSLTLARQSGGSGVDLGTAVLEIPPGEPAIIGVIVSGNQHQITVNGNVKIAASDPQPLPPGGLFLSADGAAVEFDEISVTAAGEGAPAQATTAAPTGAPAQPTGTSGATVSSAGLPAYQAASWVALGGPPGDLGYDIRYNFDDHNTWYVTDGQGGFFISTDRGLTWKASNDGIGALNNTILRPVFSATVDPHDPQTIWIGTQLTGHIYRSTDGGQSWEQRDNGISPNQGHHFRGFTVDPISSDIVYATAEVECPLLSSTCPAYTPGKLPPVGGRVYRTMDGGENWELLWQGDALARYLWIDPNDVNTLYVSTGIFDRVPMVTSPNGVGVLKSTDRGQTWTVLGADNGLTNLYISSLYMHPQNAQILLAGAGISNSMVLDPVTGQDVLNGGVFLTTDGGDNWTKVITSDAFGAVEFCAQDPNIAYAAGQAATYRSEDGGQTWQKFSDEQRGTWGPQGVYPGLPIDLQTDPDDCSRMFLNNYIGGNFLSTDGAETWTIATSGYSGAQVYNVLVDPQDAAHVYATTRMAPFVSYDGGVTWQGMSDSVMKTSVNSLAIDPSDATRLLASKGQGSLYSLDGGQSWQAVTVFTRPSDLAETDAYWMAFGNFAFAPSNPSIVYATSRNDASFDAEIIMQPDKYQGLGIFRSNDGGVTWQTVNDANTDGEAFGPILVHPTDPQIVYTAGHYDAGVFKTTDGGQTWTAINTGLPQPYERFYIMAMDPDAPDTIILLGKAGVFRTTDGGSSWNQLSSGLDPNTLYKAVVYDPTDGQVVYLGSSTQGVFYSTDGGDSFQPLTQGLDTSLGGLPVKYLGISADGSVLYAATHGSGVWRLGAPPIAADSGATQPAGQPGSADPQQATPTPRPNAAGGPCLGAMVIPLVLAILAQRRHRAGK